MRGRRGEKGSQGWAFLLLLPPFLLPRPASQDQCDARSRYCSSLFSGFYGFLFSPLFSVLLTEVVLSPAWPHVPWQRVCMFWVCAVL